MIRPSVQILIDVQVDAPSLSKRRSNIGFNLISAIDIYAIIHSTFQFLGTSLGGSHSEKAGITQHDGRFIQTC